MNEIKIGKQTFYCPESFSEITPSKLDAILKYVFNDDTYSNRWDMLRILAHIPLKMKRRLTEEQLLEMLNLLDFIYERKSLNPLSPINLEGIEFLFPVQNMQHSSIIEFAIADQLAKEIYDGNYEKLNDFFFTLCRPKTPDKIDHKFTGDLRERYNSFLIEERVKKLSKKVSMHYKLYLFFWFLGVKKHIKERYAEMFKRTEETENNQQQEQEPSEPLIIGWLKLIKSVSETGIYGNYEDTCHYSLHNFCLNLCFDIELKEKMKKQV